MWTINLMSLDSNIELLSSRSEVVGDAYHGRLGGIVKNIPIFKITNDNRIKSMELFAVAISLLPLFLLLYIVVNI